MKKLTKTLSLVLVIAMIVSLCVVGVSAKTFSKDGDKINENYKEAVDVMSGIGIIEGTDTAGTTFNPTGNFTRAAAAKIIAYMQLGVEAASALKGTGSTFKDVPSTNWAAPYIAYCAQMKIISGYGNGNFGPDDALTGYAWAKMLLCAVGYGAKNEYTGASWSINVAKDALTKGVFTDVLSASTPDVITREQATQMAFNTLTGINKVTYSSLVNDYIAGGMISGVTANGTLGESIYNLYNTIDTNGATVTTKYAQQTVATVKGVNYAAVAGVVCKTGDTANTGRYGYVWYTQASNNATKVQVSSIYYADTVLGTASNGKGVGTWATKTNSAYVCGYTASTGAAGATFYLNNGASDFATVVTSKGLDTKKGVEFTWIDNTGDGKADVVLVKNYTVAVATAAVATRTDSTTGADQFKIPGVINSWTAVDTYDGYKDIAKGDVVLSFVNAATGVTTLTKAKSVSGKVAAITAATGSYKLDDGNTYTESGLVTAGTGIDATKATLGNAVTFFTDPSGYVVYTDATVTADTSFAVIVNFDAATMAGQQVKLLTSDGAFVIVNATVGSATNKSACKSLTVGTSGTNEVQVSKGTTLVSYNVVDSVYYLTVLGAAGASTTGTVAVNQVKNGTASLNTAANTTIADSATKFILVDSNNSIATYTGISSVPTTTGTYLAVGKGTTPGVAAVVFVTGSTATATAAEDVIFVAAPSYTLSGTTSAPLYTYQVVRNGEVTTMTFNTDVSSTINAAGCYKITGYDANKNAASVVSVANFAVPGAQAKSLSNGTLLYGTTQSILVTDKTVVVLVNPTTKAMTVGAATDISASTTSGDTYSQLQVFEAKAADGTTGLGYAAYIFITGTGTVA